MFPLHVFVYGTLKRGFDPHRELCGGFLSAEPAVVRGDLYERPEGFPVLIVPKRGILADATGNPVEDAKRQNDFAGESGNPSKSLFGEFVSGEPGIVLGEILTFEDPERRLPILDRYEGFSPGEASLYLRVLVWAATEKKEVLPVWTYVVSRPRRTWTKLPHGLWPPV